MMGIKVKVALGSDAWIDAHRRALWRAVGKAGKDGVLFGADQVAEAAKLRRLRDIRLFLAQAADEGRLKLSGTLSAPKFEIIATERAADRPPSEAARKQQNMWNAFCGPAGREGLSAEDLVMLASTSRLPINPVEAGAYLAALVEGHFLRPHGPDKFYLPANRKTGVAAPLMMVVRFVLDPNEWSICRGEHFAEEVLP